MERERGSVATGTAATSWSVPSPDGSLEIAVGLDPGTSEPWYTVARMGRPVLARSRLGIERSDQRFVGGLSLVEAPEPVEIDETYTLPYGKRRTLRNQTLERLLRFRNQEGEILEIGVRAHDDGVAFRYRFPESRSEPVRVVDEMTTFALADPGRAWIQPAEQAGYYGPAYEELYRNGIPIGEAASGPSWNLPALFETGGQWALITEADLDGSYFGAHLGSRPEGREYRVVPPDPSEGAGLGDVEPVSTLPWTMPWRVVIVGDTPAAVAESDLVHHLSRPAAIADTSWVTPGRVSWSWWSNHSSLASLDELRDYIDLAAEMGWEHTLVDANWNVHSDDEVRALIGYGAERGVGVFLWYNSGGPNNRVTEQPRDRMFDRDVRRAEMAKLAEWGARGVKVDFFHSDKQAGIQLYLDILADAAERGLMVNFHGCTIPRGWPRTWPHLMTMEAVPGAEQYSLDPGYPAAAPWHNTILPFTRNAIGPMDYTPVTFSHQLYPHLTTAGHELALSVVFESGLLHLADSAASYRGLPSEVRDFLSAVPTAWDETRFLAGEPGRFVVVARRQGDHWYVGGINGQEAARPVAVPLAFLASGSFAQTLIRDNQNGDGFDVANSTVDGASEVTVTMQARGGFAARLDPSLAHGRRL